MKKNKRKNSQMIKDFLSFPLRAVSLFEIDKWGLSSLATERFDYVTRYAKGFCLDVGCGRNNRFISEFMSGCGIGIDVYKYEGLTNKNIVKDITHFPFKKTSFDTVTFIANIGHVPKSKRDVELLEAYRCLKKKGKIIITNGNPLAEILVHKVIYLYDKIFKTNFDLDSERGMEKEESCYVLDSEIYHRLKKAGFKKIKKHSFFTQWGLNHLIIAQK